MNPDREMNRLFLISFLCMALLFYGCNSNYTIDKKRGYFKIEFPERQYRQFNAPGYPYTFEYPVYAAIVKDSTFFEDKPENPWWINIDIPRFGGRIYVSYKEIGRHKLDSLIDDAFTLSFKQHTYKASSIEDSLMRTPSGSSGIYFKLAGNTATANQFFLTDSVKHFIRGALYFDATPNQDSLGIVNDFLKKDLQQLINTLRWK